MSRQMKMAAPFCTLDGHCTGDPFALRSSRHGRVQTFGYALAVTFLYWGMYRYASPLRARSYACLAGGVDSEYIIFRFGGWVC